MTDNRLTSASATGAAGITFSSGTLLNTIIWDNTDANDEQKNLDGQATALNCCTNDPFFKNPAMGDYRLSAASSLCIDKGANQAWMDGALDLAGNARVYRGFEKGTVDLGAYELQKSGLSFLLLVR